MSNNEDNTNGTAPMQAVWCGYDDALGSYVVEYADGRKEAICLT